MTPVSCHRCGALLGDLGGGYRRGYVDTPDGPACTFPSSCERRLAARATNNPAFRVAGKPKGYRNQKEAS